MRCALRRTSIISCGVLLAAGCRSEPGKAPGIASTLSAIALNGAGATFPYPLYTKWAATYHLIHPGIQINYQSIGSGAGIRQVSAGTIDFGATDVPMNAEEMTVAPGPILHVPTALGAIAVAYRLDGLVEPIRLEPAVLAAIYLGQIRRWNDHEIAVDNPNLALPESEIRIIHRSDGSGSTAVFVDYLSQISPEFQARVGRGKSVRWPVGIGAKGNEGVTGQIGMTPNSIGYVELVYAAQNRLQVARIKNSAGQFVVPSTESIAAAATSVALADDLRTSIANAPGTNAYPISSYTFLLVPEHPTDINKGRALVEFIWWAIHDGQKECENLNYAPLPSDVAAQVEQRIGQLRVGDRVALPGHDSDAGSK